MNETASIRLPLATARQLRATAQELGLPVTDTVSVLLGSYGVVPTWVQAERKDDGRWAVNLHAFPLSPMSASQVASLADLMLSVANKIDAAMTLDTPDVVEVSRVGAGVVLKITRPNGEAIRT